MIDALFQNIGFPQACHLGKKVFKKMFAENAFLTAADKKSLQQDVEGIIWQYTLKPATIPISSYEDVEREYLEIAVLEIAMRNRKSCNRLAEVVHRAIPYPLLLIFTYNNECCLSVAPKRFSKSEKGVIVADEHFITDWINLQSPADIDQSFLDSLTLNGLPHTHFLAFYSAWLDRFIAYDCAQLSGLFRVESKATDPEERRQRLASCHELELNIAELRSMLKKESQFNRKVELNTRIKNTEKKLRQLAATL
ncbi:DUF4391 domain-containing protein [Maridesulfovibrio ferrireducens]|uniref:DUF4391 domain-containing protein n=1 Tax=Maridesulfovibrio ferrireducens TaxID=246191 RepID=UPI001A22E65E|nr:DUF4391 domain-containing protein [Maridesulfovibrio ferrireducens]MBI9112743.1 DUF4391 domain-containing protein [Maridesulfovibrio ferrireducens]